jgi:MFS family permease
MQQSLRHNWKQFTLLVLINGFVGGMVGMERTILPEIAETEFHIAARTAILSFIIVFGITKALANYFAGQLADSVGRKNILITGWMFGLPVPFILMYAPDWNWIIFANVLLGINQGLAWSTAVIMKIDLVGEKDRGLAMGLNEFAGYVAVAVLAFLTGYIAAEYGLRPYPFILGIGMAVAGLLLTILFVKDTGTFVPHENIKTGNKKQKDGKIFLRTTLSDKNLSSITQAGFVTNFKDGMAWGIFPMFLIASGMSLSQTGAIVAVYPALWGTGQLLSGKLSDYTGRKRMIVTGMFIQGLSILFFGISTGYAPFLITAAFLGIGTAMVYPTFLAAIADIAHPEERAKTIGVFRLWRDSGYAFGAIASGVLADLFNLTTAILITGFIVIISAALTQIRMYLEK